MEHELFSFAMAALSGALGGVCVDFFFALGKNCPQKTFLMSLCDILMWCALTAICAYFIWEGSFWELRLYEFFALVSGVIVYYFALHRLIFFAFGTIIKIIIKILKVFFKILLTPARFLYKILLILVKKIRHRTKCQKV